MSVIRPSAMYVLIRNVCLRSSTRIMAPPSLRCRGRHPPDDVALQWSRLQYQYSLVLDEPTIGLDPGEMRDVRELIRGLAGHGATILLSSHILVEVEQVCSHVAVMNRGKLVASGSVDDLIGASRSVYLEVDDVERALNLLESIP